MADELMADELLVLRQYRLLKVQRHGDLEISVKDSKIVKLWTTDKVDLSCLDDQKHLKENLAVACS